MISYPPSLKATGGAHTGLPPANLLEVLDVNGNLYLWADREGVWPSVIMASQFGVPPTVPLPVASSSGQLVLFSAPTTAVAILGLHPGQSPSDASASPTLSGGSVFYRHGGLGLGGAQINWGGFHMPKLPPGAVIDAMISVCSAVLSGNAYWSIYDTLPLGSSPVIYGPVDNGGPIGSSFSGQIVGHLPSGADIEDMTITGEISSSNGTDQGEAFFSGVGVLIYFHIDAFDLSQTSNASDGYSLLPGDWKPWLLSVPQLIFHRSLQTDVGSFVIQNLSGDSLSRDTEKLLRASAFEGAEFVYRCWQADAEAAWIEVHGTLKVADVGVDTLTLTGKQTIDPAQEDTPLEIYCETCQLQWGGPRCGAAGSTECNYNYQTCQQPNRIMIVSNNYEKNYGENEAVVAQNQMIRRRVI
jgi:hypothetical protein